MGRENWLIADYTQNSHGFTMLGSQFNVSGTCRGKKQPFCMSGKDRVWHLPKSYAFSSQSMNSFFSVRLWNLYIWHLHQSVVLI
jgi:hypothetical protein